MYDMDSTKYLKSISVLVAHYFGRWFVAAFSFKATVSFTCIQAELLVHNLLNICQNIHSFCWYCLVWSCEKGEKASIKHAYCVAVMLTESIFAAIQFTSVVLWSNLFRSVLSSNIFWGTTDLDLCQLYVFLSMFCLTVCVFYRTHINQAHIVVKWLFSPPV